MGIYPPGSQPKGAEREVIERLNDSATEVCAQEGLTGAGFQL